MSVPTTLNPFPGIGFSGAAEPGTRKAIAATEARKPGGGDAKAVEA